jgi:putative cell wall-binding protein
VIRYVLAGFTAVLLVLPSGVATAQAGTGGLRGTVTTTETDPEDFQEAPPGTPLAGAVVTVVAPAGQPCVDDQCPARVEAVTDAEGRWRVDGLPPGDHTVHVRDPDARWGDRWVGGSTAAGEPVTVPAGGIRDGVDVVLQPAATITGTVQTPAAEPVAGVGVRVVRTAFLVVETTTGADGRFTLSGLPGATHTVAARPGGARHEQAEVTVTVADGAEAGVTLTLTPGAIDVVRVAGTTRIDTAVAASRAGFARADRAVLASAAVFADALAAAPLAAAVGGPLLLTGRRLPPQVLGELQRLGAHEVIIVGAFGAVPTVVQSELVAAGLQVRRLAGENRYDTAAVIARAVTDRGLVAVDAAHVDQVRIGDGDLTLVTVGGEQVREAIVANGGAFPDALAAAPLAAAQGLPILLVERDRIPPDAAQALAELGIDRTLVIGGTAAVSDAVLAALPAPTRVAGPERYATALAVAELALTRGLPGTTVGVATGRDFPDALAAGPVVGLAEGPLLLVDGTNPDGADPVLAFLTRHLDRVERAVVFGGQAVVTETIVERLRTPGVAR